MTPARHHNAAWKEAAPLFAALGDETRLHVVTRLCEEGPLSIARLTEGANVTRQAVTKHLRILENAGLVHSTRDGRENVWELEPRRIAEARRLLDVISDEWDDTLERLRVFVED
jgi:DNA-binding transcriptional ArsR family regulator